MNDDLNQCNRKCVKYVVLFKKTLERYDGLQHGGKLEEDCGMSHKQLAASMWLPMV
jgi:hypothetical protein